MAVLLDQRGDGSLALYIDGDLQFDSRDERVYHEGLVLPALALAERRQAAPLRVLICGGGDGLVAREVLKSPLVSRVELVDYDPTMIELARQELAELNEHSLADERLKVIVADAWTFVEEAVAAGRRYDLIVVDLTTPQDVAGARFHTTEWHQLVGALLSEAGIMAINSASPSAQSNAYWSIYNALRLADFQPRAYRVLLPSFAEHGYGRDWGFLLASPRPVLAAELDDELPLAEPRQVIQGPAHLRRLFLFPATVADRRASALPTRLGSDLLLYYLSALEPRVGVQDDLPPDAPDVWNGLTDGPDPAPLPGADDGRRVLPPDLQAALRRPIGDQPDEEALFQRVISLMPSLQPHQTRSMVAAFLDNPGRFLASIDLGGLVRALLRRAAKLPRQLVAELRLLRGLLRRFGSDYAGLLRLGMRIVTIITVVVIVSNLLFPDSVYGKGSSSTSGGSHTSNSASLAQPGHSAYDPRTSSPSYATGSGFRQMPGQRGLAIDEVGTVYPARRYIYYRSYHGRTGYSIHRRSSGTPLAEQPVEEEAPYRLTPDTDILPDGRVVITVTDGAYLMLSDDVTIVTDQKTGQPLLYLERDPAQVWRVAKEIERQLEGLKKSVTAKQNWNSWVNWLEFAHWRNEDQRDLAGLVETVGRLERARFLLGTVPTDPPGPLPAPVSGAVEIFTGVWMLPDASGLVVRQPDGIAYLDGQRWFRDAQRTQPLSEPYPTAFKTMTLAYLGQQVRDLGATQARLQAAIIEDEQTLSELLRDQAEYNGLTGSTQPSELVEYGTEQIPLSEAIKRTTDHIARQRQAIATAQEVYRRLPAEAELARRVITNLGAR